MRVKELQDSLLDMTRAVDKHRRLLSEFCKEREINLINDSPIYALEHTAMVELSMLLVKANIEMPKDTAR